MIDRRLRDRLAIARVGNEFVRGLSRPDQGHGLGRSGIWRRRHNGIAWAWRRDVIRLVGIVVGHAIERQGCVGRRQRRNHGAWRGHCDDVMAGGRLEPDSGMVVVGEAAECDGDGPPGQRRDDIALRRVVAVELVAAVQTQVRTGNDNALPARTAPFLRLGDTGDAGQRDQRCGDEPLVASAFRLCLAKTVLKK